MTKPRRAGSVDFVVFGGMRLRGDKKRANSERKRARVSRMPLPASALPLTAELGACGPVRVRYSRQRTVWSESSLDLGRARRGLTLALNSVRTGEKS
jgi:hypothetical protein